MKINKCKRMYLFVYKLIPLKYIKRINKKIYKFDNIYN
jgi:hypothetical protein